MAKTPLKQKEESNVTDISGNRLKSFLERIERLEEEKKATSDAEINAEIKSKATIPEKPKM